MVLLRVTEKKVIHVRCLLYALHNCETISDQRHDSWRPELELVGISSGSWCHFLPIRTGLVPDYYYYFYLLLHHKVAQYKTAKR